MDTPWIDSMFSASYETRGANGAILGPSCASTLLVDVEHGALALKFAIGVVRNSKNDLGSFPAANGEVEHLAAGAVAVTAFYADDAARDALCLTWWARGCAVLVPTDQFADCPQSD